MLNRKYITVFMDGIAFDELNATKCFRLESQDQAVFTVLEAAGAGQAHRAFVGGPAYTGGSAHQTGLRQINTFFGVIEQGDIAAKVSAWVWFASGALSTGKEAMVCAATGFGGSFVGDESTATTGGVAVGKKVGLLPLCNCH